MDLAIQVIAYLVGIPLQILTISALLRGGYRRFPLVFVYAIVLFLATVAEMPLSFAYIRSQKQMSKLLAKIYYTDEIILQILIFAVVISLIYQATAQHGARRMLRAVLLAAALIYAGISFAVEFNPATNTGRWMTPWSRDLKVCATILDLALWALLIGARKKDRLLLLVTGAMGILFTGEAIGESMRTLAVRNHMSMLSLAGGTTLVAANLIFLYIWWQAFRREPRPTAGRAA
jgi:hypothetical protein